MHVASPHHQQSTTSPPSPPTSPSLPPRFCIPLTRLHSLAPCTQPLTFIRWFHARPILYFTFLKHRFIYISLPSRLILHPFLALRTSSHPHSFASSFLSSPPFSPCASPLTSISLHLFSPPFFQFASPLYTAIRSILHVFTCVILTVPDEHKVFH